MKHIRESLQELLHRHEQRLQSRTLLELGAGGQHWPLQVVHLGSQDPVAPRVFVVGGIHGNERIGVDVVMAFLHSLLEQLRWDAYLQALMQSIHVVVVPVANPSGYALGQRATQDGIDLMRNAPLDSPQPHWLAGGQRLSRHLPWFRGHALAAENVALIRLIEEQTRHATFSLSVDCHSGFGSTNRLWFPWAHKQEPMPHLAEIYALRTLFRQTYPHHIGYRIEPQCQHYMTHGDLWDFLYARHLARRRGLFLPLTLEMGSWLWVRKNPRQLFRKHGWFNPQVPHRRRRILRQHLLLLQFLLRAAANHTAWLPLQAERDQIFGDAQNYWAEHFGLVEPASNSRISEPSAKPADSLPRQP
nr:DUF2817 domain-containing protein [Oceanococcus sp. HetDA_MAG_MS8]